jgi:hypothetical protein
MFFAWSLYLGAWPFALAGRRHRAALLTAVGGLLLALAVAAWLLAGLADVAPPAPPPEPR